eukprot:TRINITY_DN3695_c0_g2_i1.p1 TRINITY_DN3695_c0_g2~~TRINITY_DN3695_c0_g2_i1.p1  ORF type:complete len:818 (-),score=252.61 TRINITY_DN3695_c0_g2_i1:1784-4237(-)
MNSGKEEVKEEGIFERRGNEASDSSNPFSFGNESIQNSFGQDNNMIPLDEIDPQTGRLVAEDASQIAPNNSIAAAVQSLLPPLIDLEGEEDDSLLHDQFDEMDQGRRTNNVVKSILLPTNVDVLSGSWTQTQQPLRRRGYRRDEVIDVGSSDVPTDPNEINIHFDAPKEWHKYLPGEIQRNWSTFLLVTVGVIAGVLSATMDITIAELGIARKKFMNLSPHPFGQYCLWLIHLLLCIWTGITCTSFLAPQASGSGIPEMKSIISGIHLKYVLGYRALIVKTIGITLALGSGMILGKEGPFVHLCCIMANCLIRSPVFSHIRKNDFLLQIMLGAACAVGVASHFGAPVGGVLFSIEVTSTYYPTRNYWYAYLGAVTGATTWRYVWNSFFRHPGFNSVIISNFTQATLRFGVVELIIFGLLGFTCGCLGVAFVKLNAFGFRTWRKIMLNYRWIRSPYLLATFLGTITATITFPHVFGSFMALSPVAALSDLVNAKDWSDTHLNSHEWENRNIFVNLFIFGLSRFVLIPLSILIPIPCGLFVPSLSLGAAVGRAFGELTHTLLTGTFLLFENSMIVPGAYAVCGAAAMTASITHTLSTAVIVFEITGSNVHIIPVLITVLAGVATARKISSLGIYESLSKLKNLPYLPDLHQDAYTVTAKDVMDSKVPFVPQDLNDEAVMELLANTTDAERVFPVVHSKDDMLLVGTIDREALLRLKDYQDKVKLYNQLKNPKGEEEETPIDLVRQQLPYLPKPPLIVIRSTSIRFVESHPLNQIHLLFITMRLTHGYVTRNGQLMGVITRAHLKDIIYKLDGHLTLLKE